MNSIMSLSEQKTDLQKAVITRTQEIALIKLDEEYERAKKTIIEANDLRKLNSMVKRIDYLNNPRSTSRRPGNV